MADVLSWGMEHSVEIRGQGVGVRTVRESWIIEVDTGNSDEGKLAIYSDSRLPQRLEAYRTDPFLLCVDAVLTQDKLAPNAWHLVIDWSNTLPGGQQPTFFDNPLKRPANIVMDTYEHTKRLETDLDNKPVTTTAGELLFLEIPVDYRQITITKNVLKLPDAFAEEGNFINKDDFTIGGHKFKKEHLHLKKVVTVGPNWENGILFYVATFLILVNPLGWLFKRRNAGFQEKGAPVTVTLPDGSTKTIRPLKSIIIGPPGRRSYPSTPVLLDPNGRAYRGKDEQGHEVVLTPESRAEGGITADQWKASELSFRGYKLIRFTDNVPTK